MVCAIRVDVGSDVAGFVTIRVQFRHHRRCVHVDVVGVERVGEEARRTDIGIYVRKGIHVARSVASNLVCRAVDIDVRLRDQLALRVQLVCRGNRGAIVHPNHYLGANIKTDVEQQVRVITHGANHCSGLGSADI